MLSLAGCLLTVWPGARQQSLRLLRDMSASTSHDRLPADTIVSLFLVVKECVSVAVAAYGGGGTSSGGHRDELLCLYGQEADWWLEQQALQTAAARMKSKRTSRQTDVGGILQTSERNLLGEVPLPSWSHSRSSAYLYPHPRPPATASYRCSPPRASSSSWGGL